MRIAFVGGTGFIGHAAAGAAVRRGHSVFVIHRGVHPAEAEGVADVIADRDDVGALAAALRTCAPDAVVDTRAMTRTDAETTLSALGGVASRRVVLSSQDVYAQFGRLNGLDAPDPEPVVTEQSPLTVPYPFRGIAQHAGGEMYDKKEVEAAFREAGDAVVLRLPAVYGPRDPQRRFAVVVDALDRGRTRFPTRGGGTFRWTHAHVDDVARAIVLAAEAEPAGFQVFNVGERQTPTMRARADRIAAHMGHPIEWVETDAVEDAWGLFGPMPNDVVVDSTRIRETLGYTDALTEGQRVADLVEGLRASRQA